MDRKDRKKEYKGIIFDLDGTLINTLEDLADSVNEALERMGYPVWPTEAYRMKVGRGFRNLMENSVPEAVREDTAVIDRMLGFFVEAYDRRYMKKSHPYGERAGVPKKPDPAGALELCGRMGLKPEEVLYVGDSGTDIKTGKNAGMDTIGVGWGFRGFGELRENGAVYLAESVKDILDIL